MEKNPQAKMIKPKSLYRSAHQRVRTSSVLQNQNMNEAAVEAHQQNDVL